MHDGFWGKGTSPLTVPDGCPGPILLYTGNEGPIDAFWGSNGFMINYLAPKWGALLLFPEERYYGKSQPFGGESLTPANAVYLSTEQVGPLLVVCALVDYHPTVPLLYAFYYCGGLG